MVCAGPQRRPMGRAGRRWRARGWPTSATEATGPAAAVRPMSTVSGWPSSGSVRSGCSSWRRRSGRPPALTSCQQSGRLGIRQTVLQRRTAGALGSLTRDGYLVLHDVSLPGWPASLDHLVVGSTGVWVIHSWRRPWFARLRRTSSPESSRGGFALRPLGPRVEAEVVGQVLTAAGARLHIQPLVCVHGGCGWRLGPAA